MQEDGRACGMALKVLVRHAPRISLLCEKRNQLPIDVRISLLVGVSDRVRDQDPDPRIQYSLCVKQYGSPCVKPGVK